MPDKVNEKENVEMLEQGRRFDRWIVNLAEFFQNEKIQLIRLRKLKENSNDWDFNIRDKEYNKEIDDQLYKVYQTTMPANVLAEHNLTLKREDFDAIMYIDPELLARFQMMDDHYMSCFVF